VRNGIQGLLLDHGRRCRAPIPIRSRQAYRRLARKYHPDVSEEADAEARFKELGEAYEVLRDPEKRKAYDQLRQGGHRAGESFRPPPGWSSDGFEFQGGPGGVHPEDLGGFSDFFESLFGGARRARPQARRGRDVRAGIRIDLETAFAGGIRRLSLTDAGGGARQLDVRIPAGVTDGKQIRLAGKGEAGRPARRRGICISRFRLRPHRVFEVEDRDVFLVLPIAPWEAALGGEVKVPTLGGRRLDEDSGLGGGRPATAAPRSGLARHAAGGPVRDLQDRGPTRR
jgi:curved DNA-binding protein